MAGVATIVRPTKPGQSNGAAYAVQGIIADEACLVALDGLEGQFPTPPSQQSGRVMPSNSPMAVCFSDRQSTDRHPLPEILTWLNHMRRAARCR